MRLVDALKLAAAPAKPGPPKRIALATGFTPLHLGTYLKAHLAERGEAGVQLTTGVFEDLLGGVAGAAADDVYAAAVVVEWADLDPRLGVRRNGAWGPAATRDAVASAGHALDRVAGAVRALADRCAVAVALPSLPLPPVFHTAGWQLSADEAALRATVAAVAARLAATPRVRVVNPARLDAASPAGARFDLKAAIGVGFPYTLAHADALGGLLAEAVAPAAPRKGLITDLDDTVWLGIVGDVGPEAVAWTLDGGAQVHGLYQQLLASLAESGVLVAAASKNDPAVVQQAFARADILLPADRVYPVAANWGAKSESVREILRVWNVGPEAVVFVDDNALEVEEVARAFPQMECVLFPKADPAALWSVLRQLRDRFGRSEVVDEDLYRLASIRESGRAVADGLGAGTPEELLAELGGQLSLDWSKDPADARPLQLVNKTNQFNLNGRRIAEGDWLARLRAPEHRVVVASYRDRFGPLGKISVLAGAMRDGTLWVDAWVLSCRAFSRRIEDAMLGAVFADLAVHEVRLDYLATERNGPTTQFLARLLGGAPRDGWLRVTREQVERGAAHFLDVVTTSHA